ncbi:hypothetical protein [Litchfieldia salsa]|uniref:Uncharacterized protein n=1 Tax=Litchfieldia salsa TaxID=930152 RepID=A0A1H0VP66_9BACI|nr:hypothetical protein [Litchfieldia salsa]SDP80409.1 hypothetical protein SAMN05216565_107129 [Litchfieldia salsa]
MKQKLVNWTGISFGFSVGLFSTFLFSVTFLSEKFDKPWDIFWSALNAIIGAVIGSLIGGTIAYSVAMYQINAQHRREEEKEEKSQKMIASRILNELIVNLPAVKRINGMLAELSGDFLGLAQEMANDNKEITEGLTVFNNQIEVDLLLQLRTNLVDMKYIELYKSVELLDQIKKTTIYITNQKIPDYISYSLERILFLTNEYISLMDKYDE